MTTSKPLILVFDDEEDQATRWVESIKTVVHDDFRVDHVAGEPAVELVKELVNRYKLASEPGTDSALPDAPESTIDHAFILLLDFNLRLEMYMSGWEVARLTRAYSHCGLIVGLNRLGSNVFDLTMSRTLGAPTDVELGDRQLTEAQLWQGDGPFDGYRPWALPGLLNAASAYQKRVEELVPVFESGAANVPIVDFLECPELLLLPRKRLDPLSVRGHRLQEVTLRDFVHGSSLARSRKDREVVAELSPRTCAMLASSRLSYWLENYVLAGQDVLVDAPRLAMRVPSVREQSGVDRASFDAVAVLGQDVKVKDLGTHAFAKSDWLSRRAWVWPRIEQDESIPEVADPFGEHEQCQFVFCEDVSRFLEKEQAREFETDLVTPHAYRYVVDPAASGLEPGMKAAVAEVEYEPAGRFAE